MMGTGIGRIYKNDQQNWPYTSPKTTSVIPPHFDNPIKPQCNSDSDVSTGKNDVASDGLDQKHQTPRQYGQQI